MRVLFLASNFPLQARSGTDVSAAELIRELAGRADVELSVASFAAMASSSSVPGVELIRLPYRRPLELPGLVVPRGLRRYYSPRGRSVGSRVEPDLVIAHRLHMAYVAAGLDCRRVLVLQDVISAKVDHFSKAPRPVRRALAAHYRLVERWALACFERIYVVSESERENVGRLHPSSLQRTSVARMGFEVESEVQAGGEQPPESDVIYFGNLTSVRNQKAARRAAAIVTAARAVRPGLRAVAIGAGGTAKVRRELADAGFDFVGEVGDADAYLRASKVLLNPQESASGVKTSVLRGMGLAMACAISAPIADGIGGSPGREYEVGETEDDFVHLLSSLLADPARRLALGQAASRHVRQTFSWAAYVDALLEVGA